MKKALWSLFLSMTCLSVQAGGITCHFTEGEHLRERIFIDYGSDIQVYFRANTPGVLAETYDVASWSKVSQFHLYRANTQTPLSNSALEIQINSQSLEGTISFGKTNDWGQLIVSESHAMECDFVINN